MSTSRGTRTRLIWRDGKKVREHRWLMEQVLGRKLLPTEHVHHIDKNPLNNELDNLVVMDGSEHIRMHRMEHRTPRPCAHCGETFVPWQRNHKRQKCCTTKCAQAMRLAARVYA